MHPFPGGKQPGHFRFQLRFGTIIVNNHIGPVNLRPQRHLGPDPPPGLFRTQAVPGWTRANWTAGTPPLPRSHQNRLPPWRPDRFKQERNLNHHILPRPFSRLYFRLDPGNNRRVCQGV